jgi:predicted ester cyclase
MSLEQNKAIARRHFEELWHRGDLTVAEEIYSVDAVGHFSDGPDITGYPAVEQELVRADKVAFADGVVTLEGQLAEGDTVVTRWRFDATHTGPLYDILPSGRPVSVTGVHVHRIRDSKIVEIWAHPDTLSFMGQMGMLPSAAAEVG